MNLISGTKIVGCRQVEQKIQTSIRKFWSRSISVDSAKMPPGVCSLVLGILARVKNLQNNFLKQITKL